MSRDAQTLPHVPRRRFLLGAASGVAMAGAMAEFSPAIAAPRDRFIEKLIGSMSLEEKAGQLSLYGDTFRVQGAIVNPAAHQNTRNQILADVAQGRITGLFNGAGVATARELQKVAVEQSPHGIPLIFAADVIHGYRTIFPIGMGEAASFDADLARRTARAAAVEATALAIHWTFAPMVDIARDQRWGRVGEGGGEDTYLGCVMARARVEGFQGPDLTAQDSMLATLKHFAAYGAVQGGMEYNTVDIPETTLRETHLPTFKAGLDAGALTVMSSFNDIAGVPATANRHLLTNILRGEWGFRGLVVSDYTSEEELILHGYAKDGRDAAKKAILAGCDMSMQSGIYMKHLPDLVRSGEVPLKVLDEAVRRVLLVKKAIGLFEDPYRSMDPERERTMIHLPATHALAREAARKSVVMLKNDGGLLPLKKAGQKIALIGPLASDRQNLNGSWVINPDAAHGVTVEQGIRAALKDDSVLTLAKGCDIDAAIVGGLEAAVAAARSSDVVVMCLGESEGMSGEAQARTEITVPRAQQQLAEAVAATGKPMVVLLSHGRALALEGAVANAQAILATWFLGTEAGNGIADLLFGDFSPSGRLTCSFPQKSGQQPFYYNRKATGRPQLGPDAQWKGRYRDSSNEPLYPFGHGLTYSTVTYGPTMSMASAMGWGERTKVSAVVTNTGGRTVTEVVQLYIRDLVASLVQPIRSMKGFQRVELAAGESRTVTFDLSRADLAFVQANMRTEAEPGEFDIWIAPSATGGVPLRLTLLGK